MEHAVPGYAVEFHGLTSATHLNGKTGHLVEFSKGAQRWAVRCHHNRETVRAKPENLLCHNVVTENRKLDVDWEGRLERKIFRDIFREAGYPNGGADVEVQRFPILYCYGMGMFDQDSPRPLTFVQHRDYCLEVSSGELFRRNVVWQQWANKVADAIADVRRGEPIRDKSFL